MSDEVVHSSFVDLSVVASVAGISFLNSFFSGALTVSLPSIQKDLAISSANLNWSVSLYSLILGAFLLPLGRLADIYSCKILFLVGSLFFSAISVAIALSPSWEFFTVFSALLGLGSAANTPAGLGILGTYFEAGSSKNKAFAALGAGQPLGFIGGLVVGALLTETKLGWRTSFYIQAGLSALLAIIGFFFIPSTFSRKQSIPIQLSNLGASINDASSETFNDSSSNSTINVVVEVIEDNRKLDWIGALLSITGLVLFTFALADVNAEPKGWRTPFLPPLIPISCFLLVGFYYWEIKLYKDSIAYYSKSLEERTTLTSPAPPLLSPAIWRAPHLLEILIIVFLGWSGFNSATYFLNLILQLVLKTSPIKTALYFLPMIIMGTLFNFVPGFLLGRVNGKVLVISSMTISLAGPIFMSFERVDSTYWQFIFPAMALLPAVDILYAMSTVQISRSVPRSQQATAGALFGVTTRLATAISLSLISTFSSQASNKYLENNPLDLNSNLNTIESPEVLLAGYRVAAYLCVGCLAVGLILSLILLNGIGIVGKVDEEVESSIKDDSIGDDRLIRRRGGRIEVESEVET